jgi:hypothetical protein
MDYKTAALMSSYLAKDYSEDFFILLVNYQDISASEAASRLGLHIRTAQDFLDGLAALGIVNKTEMIRFVDFVVTKLIAFAFPEENRVVFVLTLPGNDLPYLLGIKKDYLDDTWVAIDYEGNISVNITQEDYLLFKQDLDFDQLCQSLGNVFAEFLEFSKNGQEARIIDMMNALRLNPFM